MSSMDEDKIDQIDRIEEFQLPTQELSFLVNATLNQELYFSVETTPYYHTIRLSPPCSTEVELCQQLKIDLEDLPQVRKFEVESLQHLDFLMFQFHGRRISTQQERDFFNHEKQIGWFLLKTDNELVITWDEDEEILNSSLPNSRIFHLGPLHIPGLAQKYFKQLAQSKLWDDKFFYEDGPQAKAVFVLSAQEQEQFLNFFLEGQVESTSFLQDFAKVMDDDESIVRHSLGEQVIIRSLHYFFQEVRLARTFWRILGIQNELN
jgi:hypothetical protein